MRNVEEIRKSTEFIMSRPATTGRPQEEQMRQLLANHIEATALLYDRLGEVGNRLDVVGDRLDSVGSRLDAVGDVLVGFKDSADKYAKGAEQNARSSQKVAYVSIVIALLATIVGVYFSIQSSRSDGVWQTKQLQLLKQIATNNHTSK